MIEVTQRIHLDERELTFDFMRASGPGGQNVNKVESAVQLRFDVFASACLPDPVKQRLIPIAGSRLTQDGVLILTAQRFRSQEMNKSDAIDRLVEMIRQAAVPPKVRRPTKPTKSSQKRRMDSKGKRGEVKALRQNKPSFD